MAAGDGLVSMTPSSIAHSGTSATINADGGVDFTAVTELNLNGVFTSAHDNYLIVMRMVSPANPSLRMRMRAAGTDASGGDYTNQYIAVNGNLVNGARSSETFLRIGEADDDQRDGTTIHVYGPALAQGTASRAVTVVGYLGAYIIDSACTHSLSTSYDGCTIYPSSSDITGNVHVFGYEE